MEPRRFASGSRTALRVSRLPVLALLLGLPACYSWHPVDLTPPPSFGPHAKLWVERSDGSPIVFERPQVAGDSLVGLTGRRLTQTALPLAGVTGAWESRFSGKKTAVLVVGVIGAGVGLLAYAVSQMTFDY